MNAWVLLRLVAIFIVIIAGCFVPLGPQAVPPLGWYVPLVVLSFCPIAMLIVFGVQRVNPPSAPQWRRPSWTTNPFSFRDPIQFFYFGGIVSIAQGLVTLARVLVTSTPLYAEAFVPLAMGFGVWIGAWTVVAVYRSKFDGGT